RSGLVLLQNADDLLFCEPFALHGSSSFAHSKAENSSSQWPGSRGKGHVIKRRGGAPVIPGKINRKEPILVDAITYALRNRVERCFNKLKCSRRLATRYDKTAASYLGFVHIAAARLWLRNLST
ncbi:MAG: transposase, partial [Silicimonas sp.]|uniref:transposase n=1 Tax=Roseitalea porphyridii TaxID=1852022 RepID=UPI0032EB6A46